MPSLEGDETNEDEVSKKQQFPADDRHAVSGFLQRMFDPSITRGLESRMTLTNQDLVRVPWRLMNEGNDHNQNFHENGDKEQEDKASSSEPPPSSVYPPLDYLELRIQQNNEWATDRLKEGIRLAKQGEAKRAEACYHEGLDLVPTHAELFVAHGALCANLGRKKEAIEKLERALELDPEVPNAQTYLDAIRMQQRPALRTQAGSVRRSETAMQDALMEQSFFSESRNSLTNRHQDERYPLLYEQGETIGMSENESRPEGKRRSKKERKKQSNSNRRHSDRSRHRKSRSRRKRHKRRNHSSDESAMDDSISRKRQRRHRRDRRRSFSEAVHEHRDRSSADETSEESERRHRRKRHRRRRHGSPSSDSSTSLSDRARRSSRKKAKRTKRSEPRSPSDSHGQQHRVEQSDA